MSTFDDIAFAKAQAYRLVEIEFVEEYMEIFHRQFPGALEQWSGDDSDAIYELRVPTGGKRGEDRADALTKAIASKLGYKFKVAWARINGNPTISVYYRYM